MKHFSQCRLVCAFIQLTKKFFNMSLSLIVSLLFRASGRLMTFDIVSSFAFLLHDSPWIYRGSSNHSNYAHMRTTRTTRTIQGLCRKL